MITPLEVFLWQIVTFIYIQSMMTRITVKPDVLLRATLQYCYIASAETKRDWLIHVHVALVNAMYP